MREYCVRSRAQGLGVSGFGLRGLALKGSGNRV